MFTAVFILAGESLLIWLGIIAVESTFATHSFLVANIIFICGLILFFVNLVYHGDYIYFIPIPIHTIMVYNRAGLPMYTCKVQGSRLFHANTHEGYENMLSGAMYALSTIFKELLGELNQLTYVNAQSYDIFLASLKDRLGTIVIISSGANVILKKSIQRFINEIPAELLYEINVDHELSFYVQQFSPYIRKYFPYLVF